MVSCLPCWISAALEVRGFHNQGNIRVYIGVIWGIMEKKRETTTMGYIGVI